MVNKVGNLLGGNRREGTNDFSPDDTSAADPSYAAGDDAGFDAEATTIITPRVRATEPAASAASNRAEPSRAASEGFDAATAAQTVYGDDAVGDNLEAPSDAPHASAFADGDRVMEITPPVRHTDAAEEEVFAAPGDQAAEPETRAAESDAARREQDAPPGFGFARDHDAATAAPHDTMIEEISLQQPTAGDAAGVRGGDAPRAAGEGAAVIPVSLTDEAHVMTSDDLLEGLSDPSAAAHADTNDNLLLDLDDYPLAAPATSGAGVAAPTSDDGLLDLAGDSVAPTPAPDFAAPAPIEAPADEPAPPASERAAATSRQVAPADADTDQTINQPAPARLAPEDIDSIARRVVELMSERLVREVAWEVVPELAERMIRRRLETDEAGL